MEFVAQKARAAILDHKWQCGRRFLPGFKDVAPMFLDDFFRRLRLVESESV